MKSIVAGASGLIGSELIKLLGEDVVTIGRAPSSSLRVDFENLPELPRCDVAFCCLGSTIKKAGSQEAFFRIDHDYILSFAKACKADSFLLVSALGADPNSKIFYNQVKGKTEEDLKKIGFKNLIIFRPSLLIGERQESRPGESVAQFFSPFLSFILPKTVRPITGKKVAKSMMDWALKVQGQSVGTKIILNHEI